MRRSDEDYLAEPEFKLDAQDEERLINSLRDGKKSEP